MFSETLIDHFTNPRNVGSLSEPGVTVTVENPACGDTLRLSVRFDGDRVQEARYQTRGCTASIAAGSALTEWLRGRNRQEMAGLKPEDMERELGGVPPSSRHVALLCVDAVRAILNAGSR